MTIAVTVEWHIQPGRGEEFAKVIGPMIPDTRSKKGALQCELVRDQGDPEHFIVFELWESKEDHQAYGKWRIERGDMETLSAYSAEPYAVTYYEVLATD